MGVADIISWGDGTRIPSLENLPERLRAYPDGKTAGNIEEPE